VPRTSRIHRPRRKLPATRPAAARPAPEPPGDSPAPAREPEAPAAPQRAPDEGYVAVGRVLAPFGLKGELKVQALTDNARRFAPKAKLWAGTQRVTVVDSREAQGYVYLRLKGFHDRTSVERFRHALLQVPESTLPPLGEGEFYRFQLLGLRVVGPAGDVIGTLEEVIETGANDVYRVRAADGTDLLLPARGDVILNVDLASGTMTVDPPDWR
jgi:16S rRNA processing protein RimM